ncbi:Squalene monooxygenase SE2 [Linum perenne]
MVVTIAEGYVLLGSILTLLVVLVIPYSLLGNENGRKLDDKKQEDIVRDAGGCADVIIVGAGVAGAALAHTLGKDGRQVVVIERDMTEPDRIVGELLQPGGYLKLVELGLQDCVEDIDAQRLFGYAMFKDGKRIRISYPLGKSQEKVAGRSFHNGRFIQKMRTKAASLPKCYSSHQLFLFFLCFTLFMCVSFILTSFGSVYDWSKGRSHLYSKKTGLLTEFSTKRKMGSNSRLMLLLPLSVMVDVPSCVVGLILENCQLPSPNYGHIIVGDPDLILFYPISSTETRCFIDVPGQKVPSIGNGDMAKYLKNDVAPQVPPELQDAFLSAVNKGNIRSMPNRIMPANPQPTPGALLLGDAFNMRHPSTGGGMTVALSDIVILRDLLKPLRDYHDAASLTHYLEAFYTLRKPIASTINTLAGALHKVLSASPDEARKEMREACFDYLSLGGVCSSGPMALLSGLNPRPLSFILQFFAIAVFALGRLLLPFPSPKRLWIGARLITNAWGIIFPIIKAEGVRQTFFPATVPAIYRTPPIY